MKEENGHWVKWRKQTSVAKCKAQATALNMRHAGIPEKESKRKKSR
jgi:hypothetical protein